MNISFFFFITNVFLLINNTFFFPVKILLLSLTSFLCFAQILFYQMFHLKGGRAFLFEFTMNDRVGAIQCLMGLAGFDIVAKQIVLRQDVSRSHIAGD